MAARDVAGPAPEAVAVADPGGNADGKRHRAAVRLLIAAVVIVAVLAIGGMVRLWPQGHSRLSASAGKQTLAYGSVTRVDAHGCGLTITVAGYDCRVIYTKITGGPGRGTVVQFQVQGALTNLRFHLGDKLVLTYSASGPAASRYGFDDFDRRTPLLWLIALFGVAVTIVGRRQGVAALVGLGVSAFVVGSFLLPSLLDGHDPVAVALAATTAITIVTLYLTHGVNVQTTVAVLSTVACVGLVALLGSAFVTALRLTGISDESAVYLQLFGGHIDLQGLLLAGVIVGSIGVLNDVTVTQVSAVAELHGANPTLGVRDLNRRASRIGRDHIAAAVNALVFAYVGASLPFLLLASQTGQGIRGTLTSDLVATEIMRTLIGALGLVAAVPLTTGLATVTLAPLLPGSMGEPLHHHGAADETPQPSPPPATVVASPESPRAPRWEDFGPESDNVS